MGRFNPDFWEIPTGSAYLENTPAERGVWFETEEDRERRYAFEEFYANVLPAVKQLIDARLTPRQRQILKLYYFNGKTQEDIAAELDLTQSTVSRHLFGTMRDGKKVGGALPKLQRIVDDDDIPPISQALTALKQRLVPAA